MICLSLEDKINSTLKMLEIITKLNKYNIWEVGFSGGKDSLALLHLIITFLKNANKKKTKIPKQIIVVYSDTLVEIPNLRQSAINVLNAVENYSKRELQGILNTKILKPKNGEDFFTMMIEKGYPPPHYRFRWCVPRLKIKPFMNYLKNFNGKLVMITGERKDESTTRSRIMNNRICGQLGMLQRDDRGNIIATPLKDWTKDEVFAFLASSKQPWNEKPYSYILEAYGTDEVRAKCACGLSPNVRYGCWVCTVIKKDKALELLKEKGEHTAEVLLTAKEAIRNIGLAPKFRDVKNNGKYGKLNNKGRKAVIKILKYVLENAAEGLSGYLEDPYLQTKLRSWIGMLDKESDMNSVFMRNIEGT